MIKADNLVKNFKNVKAVDGVSINVDGGQIFGLLGPNAAGKTTLIRMLCGIIKADSGSIQIAQTSVDKAKQNFGYVAQYFGQYEELSVWENLNFYARMYGVQDEVLLQQLLDRYELDGFRDQKAGALSGGYQRRLALACALAHDPIVLFLDEPTAGIDPVTRKLLWDDFYQLSSQGKTLFVTTHYMEEAQRCQQLAFMASGRLIATGTPESIKNALGEAKVFVASVPYDPNLHRQLRALDGISLVNQFGAELRVVSEPGLDVSLIADTIANAKGSSVPLVACEPNLEDVFIALTQEEQAA